MEAFMTLFLTLLVMIFIIYLSFLFSRYLSVGSAKITAAKHMKVIDRMPVGQDRFIMIINIAGKNYLVSSTGQSISILKELDDVDFQDDGDDNGFASFKSVLGSIIKPKNR